MHSFLVVILATYTPSILPEGGGGRNQSRVSPISFWCHIFSYLFGFLF